MKPSLNEADASSDISPFGRTYVTDRFSDHDLLHKRHADNQGVEIQQVSDVTRIYMGFNLSAIPAEAIISSAMLNL